MMGVPCDKLAAEKSFVPDWLGLPIFRLMRRWAIGSFRGLGYEPPQHGLNDRVPISDRGIVQAIRQGRVLVRSDVAGFAGGAARFTAADQQPEPIDVVIFATGFKRRYPLWPGDDDQRDALLFNIFHRREAGLSFMAEMVGMRSCWPIFVEQAQALAAYYAAEQRGGRVAEFNARRRLPSPSCKGRLFCLADEYHVDYSIYTQLLRELVAWISSGAGPAGAGRKELASERT
jgi:hypothetical protein